MYFVTTKRAGYVLFCLTPSEHAAVGLTETNVVHVLSRPSLSSAWTLLHEWPGAELSHTDFMVALKDTPEPTDPAELLSVLPPALRARHH